MHILSFGSYCTSVELYLYLQVVKAKQKNEELGGIIFLAETQQTTNNQKILSVVCCLHDLLCNSCCQLF